MDNCKKRREEGRRVEQTESLIRVKHELQMQRLEYEYRLAQQAQSQACAIPQKNLNVEDIYQETPALKAFLMKRNDIRRY